MATTKVKGTSKKITDEQLRKVQTTINRLNKIQMEVGIMESRKHNALHNVAVLNDELTLMQGEFEKEYGTYDIDIENGTINYPKENGKADKKD